MKIAVLSGKGGTGKTFVSVHLAAAAPQATYIDCDVEEPNGRLFLPPELPVSVPVQMLTPVLKTDRCVGCRKCVDFCQFHALAWVQGKPKLLETLCHSCGGCSRACPADAIAEAPRTVGMVEYGRRGSTEVITGILNLGEASGVPVIREALRLGAGREGLTVIDCPPGSACPVMECVSAADYCLLVAEPTAFGLHNLRIAAELARLLNKPCGLVLNRETGLYPPLEAFAEEVGIPILLRIPYRHALARELANARLCSEGNEEVKGWFLTLFQNLRTEVGL